MDRKFEPGDRVQVILENQDVVVPSGEEWENLAPHHIPIGTEMIVPKDIGDNYDGYDNSWLFKTDRGIEKWVHELALDYAIDPVTPDEEDEALASIRKALES